MKAFLNSIHLSLNKICGFLLVFLVLSCNQRQKFEREPQVVSYLAEEHKYQIPEDKDLYLIVFSGQCGSCNQRTIDVATDLSKKINSTVKIILHKEFIKQRDIFDSLKYDVFYDQNGTLLRYGLDFDKNVIMHFKNQELDYWNWLYMDQIFTVREHFNLGPEHIN